MPVDVSFDVQPAPLPLNFRYRDLQRAYAYEKQRADEEALAADMCAQERDELLDEREKVRRGLEALFGDGGETFAAYERVLEAGERIIEGRAS